MKSKEEIKKILKKKLRVERLNLNELNPVDPLQDYRLCFNGYQVFGFKEEECIQLVDWMSNILTDINDEAAIQRVKQEVLALCADFPVYGVDR